MTSVYGLEAVTDIGGRHFTIYFIQIESDMPGVE